MTAAERARRYRRNRKRAAELQRRAERTARAAAEREAEIAFRAEGSNWRIESGDFRRWNIARPVDLVLTDPPYGLDALAAYRDLPHCADRWLGEEGWCAVMTGQRHLPDVLSALAAGPLEYVWTFCLTSATGGTTGIQFLHVQNVWKPVILLRKGKQPLREWTVDRISYDWEGPRVVRLHKWQQAVEPLGAIIRATTAPGGLVADPFCGSATTGVAAIAAGRRFVGCDSDREAIRTATERLQTFPGR